MFTNVINLAAIAILTNKFFTEEKVARHLYGSGL